MTRQNHSNSVHDLMLYFDRYDQTMAIKLFRVARFKRMKMSDVVRNRIEFMTISNLVKHNWAVC